MDIRHKRRASATTFGALVTGDAFYYNTNSVLMKMSGAGEQNAVDLETGDTYHITSEESVAYICDIEIVIG